MAAVPTDRLGYRRVLLAVDSSLSCEAATARAVRVASLFEGTLTGLHAYAARLHDMRFRQMEGVLPERYQVQSELERQRDVHDTLIARGLDLISDSYLDQTEKACASSGVRFVRRGTEGKNYRVIVDEAREGHHDLVVLGYQGLGALRDVPGTVCLRVVRWCPVDTLVVKPSDRRIGEGPILVGVDGSPQSFGALVAALELARRLGVGVHAVAVFDPHFHSVAFDRISQVLSEEAGRVFRVQEQERLHAELIDSGLARIYQSHLEVAHHVAAGVGAEITTTLLAGKPYDEIACHAKRIGADIVAVGKLGVHADPHLEIGGTTELLLTHAPCDLLIVQREHTPDIEIIARETMSWTDEAQGRLERIPEFVRPMVKRAILMWALQRGHTVITDRVISDATAELRPAGFGPGHPNKSGHGGG